MQRKAAVKRKTRETSISVQLNLDGKGRPEIATGIGFFDHMLTLFAAHGFLDLAIQAEGDLEVDSHHTVEDVGLALGEALDAALGERQGIRRYGHAVTPMDEALAAVTVDLGRRPFLVFRLPECAAPESPLNRILAKEFFKSVANRAGMNLHIDAPYGENEHHILEAVFKSFGRALEAAAAPEPRVSGVRSTKGVL